MDRSSFFGNTHLYCISINESNYIEPVRIKEISTYDPRTNITISEGLMSKGVQYLNILYDKICSYGEKVDTLDVIRLENMDADVSRLPPKKKRRLR